MWLSAGQLSVARAAGALLAGAIAAFCAVVAFALIADNWEPGLSGLRAGGVLSLLAFALIGAAAVPTIRNAVRLSYRDATRRMDEAGG